MEKNTYLNKLKALEVKNEKYFNIYCNLIYRGISRGLDKNKINFYCETHHILPRCMCQTIEEIKDNENKVNLSLKEHALSHKLLVKIFPDNNKLKRAWYAMFHARNSKQIKREMTISEYEFFRSNSKELFGRHGADNGMFGKHHSDETKRKIGNKNKGSKRTLEDRIKISLRHTGNKNPFYGKKHSKETKDKIRNKNKGIVQYVSCYELTDIHGNTYKIYTKNKLKVFCESKHISYKKIEEFLNRGIVTMAKSPNCMNDKTRNTVGWSAISSIINVNQLFTVFQKPLIIDDLE